MSIQERRERQRGARREAIVTAARQLAEEVGWPAVTIRLLADRVEYSQPVLYSHFADKTAIIQAVALEGFVELAERVRHARVRSRRPEAAMHAVTRAYLTFARDHPALYEAMFSQAIGLEFASPSTPPELHAGFAELVATVEPVAGARDTALLAELYWSTLHGVATLTRSGRVPAASAPYRLKLIDSLFGAA
ncbi:MAG: TetR/AcrR family transcriptional regulator [Candidatus Dormibacteraceae bacterium]